MKTYLIERHHDKIGKITFEVTDEDTPADVHRNVARGLQLAMLVYQASPGLTGQPMKANDKSKESRVDPDPLLGKLFFSCAWIPSAADKKKPDVDAVKRVVSIIFAGVTETPAYDRDTYRNSVALTRENAEQILRNVATAPADIPSTDIANLVTWFFGGTPAEPPVKGKKAEASATQPAQPAPQAPSEPAQAEASAAPATPSTPPAEEIDRARLYKWAWDTYGLLDNQCERLIGNMAVQDRTRAHVKDAVIAFANATPVSAEEVISWTQAAFKYVELPGVPAQMRSERLRTIAGDACAGHENANRTYLYGFIQNQIDELRERVVETQ